jgi:UDPglucose 6-dehydrogenase
MDIGVIGTGFVGVTHAAATARFGHRVVAYDIDRDRIDSFSSGSKERIDAQIYEKDLADLIREQLDQQRLNFTSDPGQLLGCEAFFMCLPTPYKESGESDMHFLFDAGATLADILKGAEKRFVLLIDKSTVPIGTAQQLYSYLAERGLTNFDVASNPEFLPEGEAVKYSVHPEKIVVGARDPKSLEMLRRIYSTFVDNPNVRYVECENPETAEAIKYASNCTLYAQIVAWQAISGLIGETFPAVNFEVLRKGVLGDPRIAKWGSYVSAGAGGSCFKKDALSLGFQLESRGADARFVELLDELNEHAKYRLIERAESEAGYSFSGKTVAVLGAAFKQGTNDMRESNVLRMVPELLRREVKEVRLYDPLAISEAKRHFSPQVDSAYERVSFHSRARDALSGSDAAIIATDHQEFRGLPDLLRSVVEAPYLLIDGRRMVPRFEVPSLVENMGISYLPVGGTYVKGR